ncbi:aldo/keto reductase [Paenibacillus sp. 8b26]|uniref:aldo/keto reductase n=1 Tax=Paenibacillus sp. 8b26 TaxID=3424133 RepID=UPI003D6611E7
MKAVQQFNELASSKDITVAQLALAWLLAQDDNIVPIPRTSSIKRVEENLGATNIALTEQDIKRIAEILPNGAAGSK